MKKERGMSGELKGLHNVASFPSSFLPSSASPPPMAPPAPGGERRPSGSRKKLQPSQQPPVPGTAAPGARGHFREFSLPFQGWQKCSSSDLGLPRGRGQKFGVTP